MEMCGGIWGTSRQHQLRSSPMVDVFGERTMDAVIKRTHHTHKNTERIQSASDSTVPGGGKSQRSPNPHRKIPKNIH